MITDTWMRFGSPHWRHEVDAGFWIVNQYFGMTVTQSLKTWSTAKFLVAILGMGIILAVQAVFG